MMLRPMLASLADASLQDPGLVYEPKYDGIRAIAEVGGMDTRGRVPARGTTPPPVVRLWSRLGNEKTNQFPEIVGALSDWARELDEPVVLDGEIVALTESGNPTGFQQLQGRIHLRGDENRPMKGRRRSPASPLPSSSIAFIAFDLLREGPTDLRERSLVERRAALERLLGDSTGPVLRVSEQVRGDGRALYERALSEGSERLIAKRADSVYRSGKRTPEWRRSRSSMNRSL